MLVPGGSEGGFHRARDTVASDGAARKRNKQKPHRQKGAGFFVPSFGIRRQVFPDDDVTEMREELKGVLPGNYDVLPARAMAITVLERKDVIHGFRQSGVPPEPAAVASAADALQQQLAHSLTGVPRKLEVPLGRVEVFGRDGARTALGVVPLGWRGFGAHYAERALGPERTVLPMPVLVRETNLVAGAVLHCFDRDGQEQPISTANLLNRTPHITLARKVSGGPIGPSEAMDVAGAVQDVLPSSLDVFDPVTHVKLAAGSSMPSGEPSAYTLFARAPRQHYLRDLQG